MIIGASSGPPLGDLRAAEPGTTIWLRASAVQRKDWPRYLDALAAAIARGANVRWVLATPLTLEEQARNDWRGRAKP